MRCCLLFSWLLLTLPTAAAEELVATEIGWDRSGLETLLLKLTGTEPTAMMAMEDALDAKASASVADQRRNLSPDDEIFFLNADSVGLSIVTAGPSASIHTINIYFPIAAVGNEKVEKETWPFGVALFAELFPSWPEGATWLKDGLRRSWEGQFRLHQGEAVTLEEVFIRHREGHVYLSTIGVPPDLQIYRLTVDPKCDIDIARNDVFQRWVC